MIKKLFSGDSLSTLLWAICMIVVGYLAIESTPTLDNTRNIEPLPNQGRIPDTTINGIDYYRAN